MKDHKKVIDTDPACIIPTWAASLAGPKHLAGWGKKQRQPQQWVSLDRERSAGLQILHLLT